MDTETLEKIGQLAGLAAMVFLIGLITGATLSKLGNLATRVAKIEGG